MSTTKIEWTDSSWNPITGCEPISAGCQKCYARKMAIRLQGRAGYPRADPFQPGTVHPDKWADPIRWRKPRKIFVCSMGDLFHVDVRKHDFHAVIGIIAATPRHTFQLLTKRPENALRRMKRLAEMSESERCSVLHEAVKHAMGYDHPKRPAVNSCPWPLPNLWIGVTTENQPMADKRLPMLFDIPAAVRFVSVEPMLSPVNLDPWIKRVDVCHGGCEAESVPQDKDRCPECGRTNMLISVWGDEQLNQLQSGERYGIDGVHPGDDGPSLHWVICGAETGGGARPMDPEWARSIRDRCTEAGVSFFLKKLSDKSHELDGKRWEQFPR